MARTNPLRWVKMAPSVFHATSSGHHRTRDPLVGSAWRPGTGKSVPRVIVSTRRTSRHARTTHLSRCILGWIRRFSGGCARATLPWWIVMVPPTKSCLRISIALAEVSSKSLRVRVQWRRVDSRMCRLRHQPGSQSARVRWVAPLTRLCCMQGVPGVPLLGAIAGCPARHPLVVRSEAWLFRRGASVSDGFSSVIWWETEETGWVDEGRFHGANPLHEWHSYGWASHRETASRDGVARRVRSHSWGLSSWSWTLRTWADFAPVASYARTGGRSFVVGSLALVAIGGVHSLWCRFRWWLPRVVTYSPAWLSSILDLTPDAPVGLAGVGELCGEGLE